ncbi:TetR/AcrR family transcriptional regulator [Streptomyces sp. NPDC051776]|uniref:TetR/AcrR family transcriptional regulator n=1 Tax=Streptomyces sp. NPDC051776 TaxID=3155414 RepID=UPI003415E444
MQTEPRPRTRRTRLTPEREAELYDAVLDLLRELGYDALTMDAIAARTRSSKATLYRQWNSKPELVARALRHNQPVSPADLDTGSLRGDVQILLNSSDDAQMEKDTALLRGLAHAVYQNEDLHTALRELMIEPEIAEINAMLQRAVDRGEIAADLPALEWIPQLLIGAFISRELIWDRPADKEYLTRFVHAVIFPVLGV